MATQLGKAYVQVVPTTKGIGSMMSKEMSSQADPAAQSFSSSFSSKIKSVGSAAFKAAGAGVAAIIGGSLLEGGKLQQSLGGVETLFKGSAGRVKQYASEAYKTAGISANQYMEQATSFSASLIQSLGGDTKKAADVANMAIVDMSDNVNKMGSSMTDVQNAYQGFARGNYTMLDNLKLGYSGTRSEMQRLLSDAEKLTGVHYDINNLADVYSAIHAIQGQLGITGTTAKEAAATLQGSFAMMKAAFSDFLSNLMEGNTGDVAQSMQNLAQSASIFLFDNLVPALGNILSNLPAALGTFAQSAGQSIMSQFGIGFSDTSKLQGPIENIKSTFASLKDTVATTFSQMDFSGLKDLANAILPALAAGFEVFMSVAGPALESVVTSFKDLWNAAQPLLSILAGALMPVFQVLGSFLGGVFKGVLMGIQGAFDFLRIVIELLTPVVNIVVEAFKLFAPAFRVVAEWIGVLFGMFAQLSFNLNALKTPVQSVKNFFVNAWDNIKNVIKLSGDVIKGVINLIKTDFESLKRAGSLLKNAITKAWNGIKSAINVAKGNIQGAISAIKSFFTSAGQTAKNVWNTIKTAFNGIVNAVRGAYNSIQGLIGRIKNIFHSLGNIDLFSAGRAIMESFKRGLLAAWEGIKGWFSGIADWIFEHKGPIEYDRKLLIPAGKAIMQGLDEGLRRNFETVKDRVSGMADTLADEMQPLKWTVEDADIATPRLTPAELTQTKQLYVGSIADDAMIEQRNTQKKMDTMIELMQALLAKDSDVYLDNEKVSARVGATIRRNEKLATKYSNRRIGVMTD